MERATSTNGQIVQRRLAPLKVTIGLLYQRLGAAREERAVSIDKLLLENVISTLELVVDDLETSIGRTRDVTEPKVADGPRPQSTGRPT